MYKFIAKMLLMTYIGTCAGTTVSYFLDVLDRGFGLRETN
jgi:hypothetical protein